MYFAMDDIGDENVEILRQIPDESAKWRLIHDIVSGFGFTGIQFSPAYPYKYGLTLSNVPDHIRHSFRLTYHLGDVPQLNDDDDERHWETMLLEGLNFSREISAEDMSLHPPVMADVSLLPVADNDKSHDRAVKAKERLHRILNNWLPKFKSEKITLSIESHMTPLVFVLNGIRDFSNFVNSLPGLGVLIDISHNFYDGYGVTEVIDNFKGISITGLHLSDSIRGKKLGEGTHLEIGRGHVDFKPLLHFFDGNNRVYGALEVRGPVCNITNSLARLTTC